jgi:hypothetical protein
MQNQQEIVSTAAAAKRFGLGEDAIRKRIKRGVLKGYKKDNKWYVVLDGLDRQEQESSSVPPRASTRLVAHLEAEIEFLRTELKEQRLLTEQQLREKDEDIRSWQEQARYKDLVIARLEDRLIELPNPADPPQSEAKGNVLSRFWHWFIGR